MTEIERIFAESCQCQACVAGKGWDCSDPVVVSRVYGSKPSNPKDAVGIKKTPFSTIPAPVLAELGVGMLEGALKYGRHNFRAIGVRASVYYDATMRHMMQWWEGEDIDPDSGLSHVTKAIASLVVLRDAMMQNKFNDDRPPKSNPWIMDLNAKVIELLKKYPDPVLPYTQVDQSWVEVPCEHEWMADPNGWWVCRCGKREATLE